MNLLQYFLIIVFAKVSGQEVCQSFDATTIYHFTTSIQTYTWPLTKTNFNISKKVYIIKTIELQPVTDRNLIF